MNEKSVNKCQSSQYTNFESNLNDWHLLIDKVSVVNFKMWQKCQIVSVIDSDKSVNKCQKVSKTDLHQTN